MGMCPLEQQHPCAVGRPEHIPPCNAGVADLTKDAPPRLRRFQKAAPRAEPTRIAADAAATRAMAHCGNVLGTAKAGSDDESSVPDEDELPDALSGAAAEAGPAAGPLRSSTAQ